MRLLITYLCLQFHELMNIAGKVFLYGFIFSAFVFTACKKDETTTVDNNPQENYLALWKGDTTQLVFPQNQALDASGKNAGVGFSLTDDSTGTTVLIAGMGRFGTDSSIVVIRKRVPKSLLGIYDLNFNAAFIAQGDATSSFLGTVPQFFESLNTTDLRLLATYSGSGILQISKYDANSKMIWGTFSFVSKTGKAPKASVTRGVFNGIHLVQ